MLFALLFPNHKKYLMSFLLNSFLKFLGLVKKKSNLLIVGLDYSGKTTIVNQIKPDPVIQYLSCIQIIKHPILSHQLPSDKASTIPTVGFSVEQFVKSKITFTVFDMSGAGRYRNLWEHYYGDADAIIFVLDASDKARLLMARDEFESMMEHKCMYSTITLSAG